MPAYYNEIEPYCVQWLRNLIDAGLIPEGDVDDRPIEEVTADDIRPYKQAHFFAGIGGWAYAARLAGWPDERPLWTGSCPCQPFSNAGKRLAYSDPRNLWPDFARLIADCRPSVVAGEQVASAAGRLWLSGTRADLEALGYGVGAADLCAACISAPHVRQRLWFIADSKRNEQSRQEPCCGAPRRMGRIKQPVSWDRNWESALCEFRAMDDGLSYGVAATDAVRNAIVPALAAEFLMAYDEIAWSQTEHGRPNQ